MPARKPVSLVKHSRKFIILLLIGLLFLTSSAFVAPPAQQSPDPFAKHLPASGMRSHGPEAVAPALPATAPNTIQDSSFELSHNSTVYWGQYSANFGTPLCITAECGDGAGTAGPRTGSVWAWFGGVDFAAPGAVNPEGAQIYQYVTIPSCGATLKFYFWIGRAAAGSDAGDFFSARLGGTQLFLSNATQKNTYPSYKLVTVNVNPGTFTPGVNILYFGSVVSDQVVSFNLDDVTLIPNCFTISGSAGVEGVTINYTGGMTTTDHNGDYIFNVPPGWSGTAIPSKSRFTFSPVSRTYTNVTSNKTAQNYTATSVLNKISGDVGVAGVNLSYWTYGFPNIVTSQADGAYTLGVPDHWSDEVVAGHPCFTFDPVSRVYSDVTADHTAQDYTPSFDPSAGCADISTEIGGVNRGRFGLLPGASTRASFTGINNGPVKIVSTNTVPLIGAERLIYKVSGINTSFAEMMALPNSQLDTTYWLPWYNNVDLDTQLRFANVSGSPASVHIFIGGQEMTGSPFTLTSGESTRKSFAGVNAGPVKIQSDVNIVAAERLIYKVNNVAVSFSETMAVPNSQLDKIYYLPWYNNVDLDAQLRIGNVSGSTATVHIFIGTTEVTPVSGITLGVGGSTRVSYVGVNNGPVKIVSDQNIVTAERLIYKVNGVNTSFTEMMALPASQLDTTYYLPWYNNNDLDTQLRFANVTDQPASVHVYIGSAEMTGSPFTLLAGESTRKSFPGINAGPVQIVSDHGVPIVAAERLIYKVNNVATSFSEMLALPESQLDTIYWLPWYNNVDLDTQLRFGVP